jgi:outer membrane protein OmpA-like peptidoglycan-associated protein
MTIRPGKAVHAARLAFTQFVAAAALTCVAHLAQAQNVMVYGEDQTPSAQDVADILSRGAAEAVQHRGLQTRGMGSPFAALEQKPVSDVKQASALSVPVQFAFDSSELSEQSRKQLNAIAEGIRLTEGTVLVVVEGHTDAKGRATYNDKLSLRRAQAVRDFLIKEGKVMAKVLNVEGKGSHQLLDKVDPYNPRNRRVQFRAG